MAYPSWLGLKRDPISREVGFSPTLVMSLLKVDPTAMGLIPPSFLLRAYKFAPKKMGRMSSGILCLRTRLTNLVMDSKSLFPASAAPIKFFRWHGFRPSGPPADPAGNDRMDFLTESDDTGICTSTFSEVGGGERYLLEVSDAFH